MFSLQNRNNSMETAGKELVPESVKQLQKYYGDGTENVNTMSNAFYKHLDLATGMRNQAASVLRTHLKGGYYRFTDSHIKKFEEKITLISEDDGDLEALRTQLYNSDDFLTSLIMGDLLDNRDDAEEAKQAFNEVFLKKDANSLVQLYFTDDEDIFSGVILAAKQKDDNHAVYLVYVTD